MTNLRKNNHLPFEQRFHASYQKQADGCWIWIGRLGGFYGQISKDRKQWQAHRASWELHFGPIPTGFLVLHKCDVRKCVRPDHLFLGSAQDNTDDMVNKLRHYRGERQWKAVLSEADIRQIRELYKRPKSKGSWAGKQEGSLRCIAEKFNISISNVSDIVNHRIWRHVH